MTTEESTREVRKQCVIDIAATAFDIRIDELPEDSTVQVRVHDLKAAIEAGMIVGLGAGQEIGRGEAYQDAKNLLKAKLEARGF